MTGLLLVIDTATRSGVVGLADEEGGLLAADTWATGHRHGEELVSRLDTVLARVGKAATDITAVAVGIGPGSFTGLRIGLATAKTLAYALQVPLVGVSTVHGLAVAAASEGSSGEMAVVLPAGAHDRYVARFSLNDGRPQEMGPTELVASLEPAVSASSVRLVAVDLEPPEVPESAVARGAQAVDGLAAGLARLAAEQLAAGETADVAELVPAYVALPRGLTEIAASVEWSPDLR